MPQPPESGPEPSEKAPAKTRTWWHPLLTTMLRWLLAPRYRLEDEVPLGKKPLQLDVAVIQVRDAPLPDWARRILVGVEDLLNEMTLVEFKSPTDVLALGDVQTFLAYSYLYRVQRDPLLSPSRLSMLVLAPRLTEPYRNEMACLGITAEAAGLGRWKLHGPGLIHTMWLVETSVLGDTNHPLLAVFSPHLLRDGHRLYRELRAQGHGELVTYMAQQIHQFRRLGEDFAMQHLGTNFDMKQVWREILDSLTLEERLEGLTKQERLEGLTPEDLLERVPKEKRLESLTKQERLEGLTSEDRLEGLPKEKRLEGLTPEDLLERVPKEKRLEGLTPEDLLESLTPQEIERLLKHLEKQTQKGDQGKN